MTLFLKANDDIEKSLKSYKLIFMLGYLDIKQKYRRSILGPFWLTISMGVMISSIGIIFGAIMGSPIDIFLPSLALGMIVWGLITGVVGDSCNAFVAAEAIIKQLPLPLFIHILRILWRNAIIFLHNFIIYPFVAFFLSKDISLLALCSILGFLLLLINLGWISLVLSIICARYRDLPQIINSVMQVAFYITPIVWVPSFQPIQSQLFLLKFNPFFHFLDIVRAPILGSYPEQLSWYVSGISAILGWIFAYFMFNRYKKRITYWL